MLPQVRPSSEFTATPTYRACASSPAWPATSRPPCCSARGCFSPGDAKNTYGTGCFLLMNTGDKPCASRNGLLTTVAVGLDGGAVRPGGPVFVGGAVIQWLRDELRFFPESRDAEYYAQKVPDNGGVYLVPAFTGLGEGPYWDMYARGILVGLTRGTRRAHHPGGPGVHRLPGGRPGSRHGGGYRPAIGPAQGRRRASRDAFLMQFQADILDRGGPPPRHPGRPPPWGQPIWPVWPPGCGAVPASCAACGGATPPSPPCRRSSGSTCWSSGTGRWAAAGTGPGRKSTHLPFSFLTRLSYGQRWGKIEGQDRRP